MKRLQINQSSPYKCNVIQLCDTNTTITSVDETSEPSENISNNVKRFKKPRGLNNLGNTCFYNSILQCLAQTPFLRSILHETSKSTPPLIMKLDNEDVIMQRQRWSNLTKNLYTTLQEINNECESAFTPNVLLDSLRKKCNMFIGNDQEDAHELLRQLMDSIRDHDLKRNIQTIVHHYGESMNTEPSKWDKNKCIKIKSLVNKLKDMILLPDMIFKGQLLIVDQCHSCGHKSERTESFLDLSLPITVHKDHVLNIKNNHNPIDNLNNDRPFFESKIEKDENMSKFSLESSHVTLRSQTKFKNDECSIISCFNKFTASEIMSGNNKIVCRRCTEKYKQNAIQEKLIYRKSTIKNYIYSPPAILILHLKRFQFYCSTIHKITTYVSFPWILDIAPYCSTKCQNKSPGQKKILYSLYGVVEHSGHLNSGHYYAYVKARDSIEDDCYRFSFLESNTKRPKIIDDNNDPSHLAPSGNWYYVSDNVVKQVTPNIVQKCNAYLLFYERIL